MDGRRHRGRDDDRRDGARRAVSAAAQPAGGGEQPRRAFLRRVVRERRRDDELLLRLLEHEQGDRGDPARTGQHHHAEGIRRPAADIVPRRGAGDSGRRRWRWSCRRGRSDNRSASRRRGRRPGHGPRAAPESQPARSRARRLHHHRPPRLQGRCGVDAAARGADLVRARAIEVVGVPAQLAHGDGLDAAVAPVRTGRSLRARAGGPAGRRSPHAASARRST